MAERALRSIVGALICCTVVLITAVAASADHVAPEAREDNPACGDLAGTLTGFTINTGNGEFSDGVATVTVTDYDGETFDWSSDIGLDAVIVWGGPDGNGSSVYSFASEETADENAHALNDPNNGFYPTFHAVFCYDASANPSPSPSVTISPTSNEPSVVPTDTLHVIPTHTAATVLGRQLLPGTGPGGIGAMVLMAMVLLVLGSSAYVVAARTSRSR